MISLFHCTPNQFIVIVLTIENIQVEIKNDIVSIEKENVSKGHNSQIILFDDLMSR